MTDDRFEVAGTDAKAAALKWLKDFEAKVIGTLFMKRG